MRSLVSLPLLVIGLTTLTPLQAQDPLCPSPDSLAGMGAIVGRVVDAQTQIPLGFAQIRLRIQGVEAPFEAQSNPAGLFQFCSVPFGVFTLTGQIGQFGAFEGPLALAPGQTLQFALELSASASGRDTGTLTGIVVDAESGEPVEGANIILPSLRQTAISNALGRFTFPSLTPGGVDLHVNRLGYAEAYGQVEIEVGKTIQTRVTLSTEPIGLDPIMVTATRRRIELPGLEEFERRFHSGWGSFILEEQIQRRSPRKLTDMLYETGVGVGNNGATILMRRTGCAPLVYLDDVKLTRLSRSKTGTESRGMRAPKKTPYLWPDPDASPAQEAAWAVNLVHPMDIVAVEVYSGPAQTPGQYIDSNSQCGVILIWTRRGIFSGG